jgi:hypothetical protein
MARSYVSGGARTMLDDMAGTASGQGRRVALRRSPARLAMAVLVRGAIGAIGLWTGIGFGGSIGTALMATSAVVLAYAVLLALVLGTVRVEIEPDELIVTTMLGGRRYQLAPGELRRLHVPRHRSPLAVQVGFLGAMLGRANLGGEDLAGVVALAPVESLILVPTVEGRVGIAPRFEQELIEALLEATRH